MHDSSKPLQAPPGARGWTADVGYVFEEIETVEAVARGGTVLMVSADGLVRGIAPGDRAPLAALLRVETDLVEIVRRLDELADRVEGVSTGDAIELIALKARLRRLEEGGR